MSNGFSLDHLLLISEYDKYHELLIGQHGSKRGYFAQTRFLVNGSLLCILYICQQFSKIMVESKGPITLVLMCTN